MPKVDDLISQLLGRGERIPAQKRRRLAELALVFVRGLNGAPFLAQRSRCRIVGEPINNRPSVNSSALWRGRYGRQRSSIFSGVGAMVRLGSR